MTLPKRKERLNSDTVEVLIEHIVRELSRKDSEVWKVFSRTNPLEAFPQPTEKETEALKACCVRTLSNRYHENILDSLSYTFYNVTKGHYLRNGNKRVACCILAMLSGLMLIREKREETQNELYEIVLDVAKSRGNENKELIMLRIREFINNSSDKAIKEIIERSAKSK